MTTHEDLASAANIRLTTFRANGVGVGTPVWTASDPDHHHVLYTITTAASGKVKRIRANPLVTIAPSDWQGHAEGDALDATARVVESDTESELIARADTALTRKYEESIELLRSLQRNPWVVLELSLRP